MRRKAVVDDWRATHGEVCPGYGVPAHLVVPPNIWTADHVEPVSMGGDTAGELRALCNRWQRAPRRSEQDPPMRTAYRTAFAMFRAQEVDDMAAADELWIGYKGSDAELVRGMTLVTAVLRKSLLEHAERIGCPCGSDEWLAERLLDANLHDEKEEL